ncbi:XRE family transcriptional regulator [Aequoribacter fuscus]|uniref:helix-turn-helix domain-containing protein n=1 Tax=Aequoribacter fuscus TaxID=2518989 RepID=UPI000A04822D|nr:helix-turn-helix transcriptional regulator [Aequoribacter fuscus]QHJ88874.1 XRE family transcriptional regulator [Aequoribacter fuscus]
MISSSQIRSARAMLNFSGLELAKKSGISMKTLRRYESQEGIPVANTAVLLSIKACLESYGIEFTGDPLKNPGVILHISD